MLIFWDDEAPGKSLTARSRKSKGLSAEKSPVYQEVKKQAELRVQGGGIGWDLMAASIGALPSLRAHQPVIQRFGEIFDTAAFQEILNFSPTPSEKIRQWWRPIFKHWDDICAAVRDKFPDAGLDAAGRGVHHPIRGHGLVGAPLSSVLYLEHEFSENHRNKSENQLISQNFFCLQTMLTAVACIHHWHGGKTVADYCKWIPDGKTEFSPIPVSSDSACRFARSLSEAKYARFLTDLPTENNLSDFSECLDEWAENHISALEEEIPSLLGDRKDECRRQHSGIKSLRSFFTYWSSTLRSGYIPEARTRSSSHVQRSEGHTNRSVDGYISLRETIKVEQHPRPLVSEEPRLNDEEPESARGIAEADLEFPRLPLVPASDLQYRLSRLRWKEMQAAMRSRLPPWDIRRLAAHDAQNLAAAMLARVLSPGSDLAPNRANDGPLLVLLQLALGQRPQDIIQLRAAEVHVNEPGRRDGKTLLQAFHLDLPAPVFLMNADEGCGRAPLGILVPALRPQLSAADTAEGTLSHAANAGGGHTARNLLLPLQGPLAGALKQRAVRIKPPSAQEGLGWPVFAPDLDAGALVTRTLDQLSPMSCGAPWTSTVISSHMGQSVEDVSGDPTCGWLITRNLNAAGEARMYYTQHSLHRLADLWLEAMRRGGLGNLLDIGSVTDCGWGPDQGKLLNLRVGARFVPPSSEVKKLLAELRRRCGEDFSEVSRSGWIIHHNHLVLYTVLVQGLCTGLRAVRSPVPLLRALEQNDHVRAAAGLPPQAEGIYAGLADKETFYNQRARLVHLHPILLEQLRILQQHQRRLAHRSYFQDALEKCGNVTRALFQLDSEGKPRPVTVKWVEDQLRDLGFPWPANFARAFLRTRLLESGWVASADIDALLGHRDKGGGAIGLHSTFDNHASIQRLKDGLDSLHQGIGLDVVRIKAYDHFDNRLRGTPLIAPMHMAGPTSRGRNERPRGQGRIPKVGPFWMAVHQRVSDDDRRQLRVFVMLLGRCARRHGNALAAALVSTNPLEANNHAALVDSTGALVDWLRRLAEKGNRERFHKAASWFRLLQHARKKLNHAGITIPDTQMVAITRLPTSPFRENVVLVLPVVDGWKRALEIWRETAFQWARQRRSRKGVQPPWLNPEDRTSVHAFEGWATALLWSAVLHGMLLDRTQLSLLLQRFCTRRDLPLSVEGDRAHLDFEVPASGSVDRQLHRWWFDPLTELIWLHAPAMPRLLQLGDLHPWLRRITVLAFRHVPDRTFEPRSFSDLVRCAEVWWQTRTSRTVVASHRRQIDSSSVLTTRWGHMAGAGRLAAPAALGPAGDASPLTRASHQSEYGALALTRYDSVRAEEAEEIIDGSQALLSTLKVHYPWVDEVAERLRSGGLSPPAAVGLEELLPADAGAVERTLAGFAVWLAQSDEAGVSGPAALRSFTAAAQSVLQSLSPDQKERPLDAAQLAHWVIEIDEDPMRTGATAASRREALLRLGHYLGLKSDIQRLLDLSDDRPAPDRGRVRSHADARVLTFEDFEDIDTALRTPGPPEISVNELKMARLLLSLCFRCGLRPGEAYGLRLRDIDLAGACINVLPYTGHELKSDNARRRIPLTPFVSAEMLKWIARHIQSHLRTGASPDDLLLRTESGPLERGKMDRFVHRIMRQRTNDPSLRLYHARHSFATWLDLALRTVDSPQIPDFFTRLPKTRAFLQRGSELMDALCGSREAAIGRTSYVIARLVGHIGPAITHMHYLHGEDIVRAAVTFREVEPISKPQWGEMLGLQRAASFRQPWTAGIPTALSAVTIARKRLGWHSKPIGLLEQSGRSPANLPGADGPEAFEWISIDTVLAATQSIVTHGDDPRRMASLHGLEADRLDGFVEHLKKWLPEVAQPGTKASAQAGTGQASLPKVPAVQSMVASFEHAASGRAQKDRAALRLDLEFLIHCYDRRDRDFHAKGAANLHRLCGLLEQFGLTERNTVIITRAADPQAEQARLASALSIRDLRSFATCPVHCIKVRSLKKADSYRQWTGLMPVLPSGEGCGQALAVAAVIALGVVGAGEENKSTPTV